MCQHSRGEEWEEKKKEKKTNTKDTFYCLLLWAILLWETIQYIIIMQFCEFEILSLHCIVLL